MRNNRVLVLIIGSLFFTALITLVYFWVSYLYQEQTKRIFISVILKNTDFTNDFWSALRDGVVVAAADYNAEFEIKGPKDENNIEDQMLYIEEAIFNKPDAIVLAAADFNRIVPFAQKIKKSQIPLIIVDSSINSDDAACVISTDNRKAGIKAGKMLMKYLPYGSRVTIMNHIKMSSTAIDRETGVRDYLQGKAIIAPTIYYLAEENTAYLLTRQLLQQEPLPDGLVALNLPGTAGCARALKESGKAKDIVLIGFDSSTAIIEYLQEGIIREIIVQKPFNMGYLGIKTARELIDGKPVQSFIDTGSESISRENMFLPENQKLLFPVNK